MIYYSIMAVLEKRKLYLGTWRKTRCFFCEENDMDKQMARNNEPNEKTKNESIWKNDHTPMAERTTSSGLTFWPKKVVDDG